MDPLEFVKVQEFIRFSKGVTDKKMLVFLLIKILD